MDVLKEGSLEENIISKVLESCIIFNFFIYIHIVLFMIKKKGDSCQPIQL